MRKFSTLPIAPSRRPSARREPTRSPLAILYLLAVAAYALLSAVWQVEPVPMEVHLAAVIVAATCFLPLFIWLGGARTGIPLFEIILLSYALQFSMPVFTQFNRQHTVYGPWLLAWNDILRALAYAELGIVALLLGYYAVRRSAPTRDLPALDLPLDPRKRSVYLRLAFGIGGLALLLQSLGRLSGGPLGAIILLVISQFNLALVLLAYQVYTAGPESRRAGRLLWPATAFAFAAGLLTGLLENAFIPLLLVLLVRWHATRRFPWLGVGVGILLLLVLNPAKFEYRDRVWFGGEGRSVTQRVNVWGEAVGESAETLLVATTGTDSTSAVQDTLARFDLIHKFAYVQTITPAWRPYYGGSTYSYFLVAWIPRFLWPGKPTASGGANDQLDVDYGLKVPGQRATIGVGLLPEAYVNFGPAGIAAVMALQGAVFALLDRLLNGRRSEGGRAIYLVVMIYFLNGVGTSASILFGALLQYILGNALILRLFATGWQAPEDVPPHQPEQIPSPTRGSNLPARRHVPR